MGRARNRIPALVPINSLPCEILTRIFRLICDSESFCGEADHIESSERNGLPKYPDLLLSVCSHWRHILTTSHRVWSHIDLIPHHSLSKQFLARAQTYVARACRAPLEIHIVDPDPHDPDRPDEDDDLLRFLASVAPQIRSLKLDIRHEIEDCHAMIFYNCFATAEPGTLKQLCISAYPSNDLSPRAFLEGTETSKNAENLSVALPEQLLGDLWRPITILHLSELYPYWTSQAYHGLVELRLTPFGTAAPPMTELQLARILKSSPRLRILHLNINITESPLIDDTLVPVRLDDLRTLNVSLMEHNELGILLRMLAPGSKSLDMTLALPIKARALDPNLKNEIRGFFARSKITRLRVERSDTCLWLTELLGLTPYIQALTMFEFTSTNGAKLVPLSGEAEAASIRRYIDDLTIKWSTIDFDELWCMLKRYPVHTLTLWNSSCFRSSRKVSIEDLGNNLAQICPGIKLLTEGEPTTMDDRICLLD